MPSRQQFLCVSMPKSCRSLFGREGAHLRHFAEPQTHNTVSLIGQGKRESISSEYVMHILGLGICSDTLIGSQAIRGISGGQRKRVTTGTQIQ